MQFKDERDYGQLYLYFAPRTMFSEELELYTSLSLMAEIGGYVGLLLGASLVNIGQINGVLLDFCFGKEESLANMSEKQQTVKTIEPIKVQSRH